MLNNMREEKSLLYESAYMIDILCEGTKALRLDLAEMKHKEYDRQFRICRKAYKKELTDLAD